MTDRTDQGTRTDADRLADHAAIGRLADDLVPALVAKLTASGLGEIEVREGDWHVRVRMPVAAEAAERGSSRRAGAPVRTGAAGPGLAASPGDPASAAAVAATPDRAARASAAPTPDTTTGRARSAHAADADGTTDHHPRPRAAATSPAVGIYRAVKGVAVGSRVRAGDRIGVVDVLGVPHDVVAPEDGVIGGSYVDDGEGVEYGQELVRIELAAEPARTEPAAPAPAEAAR